MKRNRSNIAAVYVIGPTGGPHKIGWANNANQRRRELQTGNHQRLEVLFVYETDVSVAQSIERSVHVALKDFKIAGEWFSVSADEAQASILEHAEIRRRKAESEMMDLRRAEARKTLAEYSEIGNRVQIIQGEIQNISACISAVIRYSERHPHKLWKQDIEVLEAEKIKTQNKLDVLVASSTPLSPGLISLAFDEEST